MADRKHLFSVTPQENNQRLDRFIASRLPPLLRFAKQSGGGGQAHLAISRSQIQRIIHLGNVSINSAVVDVPHHKVKSGDKIQLCIPPPAAPSLETENIPLDVLYEDTHLLIINKPAGLVCHPVNKRIHRTLVNALMYHCKEALSNIGGDFRRGLVHRLDKDTSGVMVVAKDNATHTALSAQFKERKVKKVYVALAWGRFKEREQTISTPIGRSATHREKMSVFSPMSREARTSYEVKEQFLDFALLEVSLHTGRTHQIRVHLSSLGHAVVGDPLYGGRRRIQSSSLKDYPKPITRQLLHAHILGFHHPGKNEFVEFESPLPEDMRKVVEWAMGNQKTEDR